jgi:TolB-like protein
MKNLFTAIILGIALAGVSFAQSDKPRIAVIEFKPEAKASSMSHEAKRLLQANIASAFMKTRVIDVPDVRNTRALTPAPDVSPAAALKIGKKLGVDYVLIGSVVEYTPNPFGRGQMAIRTQLVDVATGRVKVSGETSATSSGNMTGSAGHAEMSAKVVKPLVEKLTASIRTAL